MYTYTHAYTPDLGHFVQALPRLPDRPDEQRIRGRAHLAAQAPGPCH
jgi:hypothetical protein